MTSIDLVIHHGIQRSLQNVEDPNVRSVLKELVGAVDQLQRLQICARKTENDNLPSDNQLSEQFNGQFMRFVSKGFGDLVHTRSHGLGRVPQGCLFIRGRSQHNECLIEGDAALGIEAATMTKVSFVIADDPGQIVVALLL